MRICFLLCLFYASPIWSGGWAFHLKSTQKAVDVLPAGELKNLLYEHMTPLLNGAKYPDGGHSLGEYETSHWLHSSEFFNLFIDDIEKFDCKVFNSKECQKKLVFILGCVAHEMGDDNFDRHFLTSVAEADFNGNFSKAQQFTDKRFDTVIIKRYDMFKWVPKIYHPLENVYRAFTKADITVSRKDLRLMQLMQRLQYAVLTSYAENAGERIARISSHATNNFVSGPGGINDTADKIARLWLEAWDVIETSKNMKLPRFRTWGHWPYNNIEVLR